jgi:molecular chaperone DnaK
MDYLIDEFKRSNGIDLHSDRQALQRLKESAEKAKIELSTVQQTEINLPYITADATGPKHLVMTLTRSKLEQLTGDLVQKTLDPIRHALTDAGLKASDINEVVLVGGMIRMPAVQEAVKREFGKEPHKGVNPDEVVAEGAAIQGGVLGGEVKDILLLDVTPLTLSVETYGGISTPIIERNTTIPTRKSQVFSTASDGQTQVEIHVLQGERPMAVDNKSLGKFILDGIPSAPRGIPQIEVTFDIDANGIINVTALDKATNRSQHITITASSGLSESEIQKMKTEAEVHAEEDRKRKEMVETKNTADNTIYTAEKMLKDGGEKIPAELKKEVEDGIAKVRTEVTGENNDAIHSAVEGLNQSIQKIGAAMYTQPGGATEEPQPDQPGGDAAGGAQSGPTGGNQAPGGDSGDVVDGDFKSV